MILHAKHRKNRFPFECSANRDDCVKREWQNGRSGLTDSAEQSIVKDKRQAFLTLSVGSTFMPPVFGLIAAHVSIRLMPLYVLFFILLMFGMVEQTFRISAQRSK